MTNEPYIKSLDDELDWKLIDQLHLAVLQISGFCFEAKKLCASIVFIVITVIATFTSEKLDHAVFVAGAIIPLFFWFLDAVGYYYQVKLRASMESMRKNISARNSSKEIITGSKPFISKERADASAPSKVISSFFNHSMWLYGVMIGSDLVIWIMFCLGAVS